MVDERESPSAGWREVYREMDADPSAEEPTYPCPDCGRSCRNLVRDVYECDEHGVFRASASGSASPDGDARETADDEGGATADRDEPRRADRDDSEEASRRTRRGDSPDADETHHARGPVGSD